MAGVALLTSVAGCGRDEVEPLHGMQRPSAERRAGLPEIRGRWLFAGWEVAPRDTAAIRNDVYQLTPPGEFRFLTQRLDSVAGQYGRPGQQVLPFVGEVRRDSIFALLAFVDVGVQQFASGRIMRDTLWLELTNLGMAERWPPRTRAAFVRQPRGAPFTRLLGGIPIIVPPDSAMLDSIRRDSLRADSLMRAGAVVVPGAVPPGAQPGMPPQPGAVPPGVVQPGAPRPGTVPPGAVAPRPAAPQPGVARPPAGVRPPAPQPGVARPPAPAARPPAPRPPAPRPPAPRPATVPNPTAPRDTFRIGQPPTQIPAPDRPAPIIPTAPRETIRIGVPRS